MRACSVCAEFADPASGLFQAIYGPEAPSRLLSEIDGLAVLPTIGQLGSCHLLLAPLNHVTSFALADQTAIDAAERVVERLRQAIQLDGSQAVVFEHGLPHDAAGGGCGV